MKKIVYSNLQGKRKKLNPKFKLGQLVRTADIKRVFSKGDSTNYSYKLYTITEIIHDTIPSYRPIDLYKIYEGDDYDEIYKVLSTLKNKKLKINNKLIDIYKDLLLNTNFEQNKFSLTAKGIYKIGHDSFRLMKWICYYDRSYYENINYYDLMSSLCLYYCIR